MAPHQVLTYSDDVNVIGDDIRTRERNAVVLLTSYNDIGLVTIIGKTKYKEIGSHKGMIVNPYKEVKTFRYLGSLVTNQISIVDKIKCRL